MKNLVLFSCILFLLPILGLAVKQISFILIYGSIFEPFRRKITDKFNSTQKNKFFWEKIKELFSCNLCLTAQVSIWVTTFPLFGILYCDNPHFLIRVLNLNVSIIPEILFNIFVFFIFAMATSASAMALWEILEYLPKKLKFKENFYREKILVESMKEINTSIDKKTSHSFSSTDFTFDDFKILIEKLSPCADFDCGNGRKECREKIFEKFLKEWYKKYGQDNAFGITELRRRLEFVLKKFYSDKDNSEEKKRTLYNKILKSPD